MVPVFVRLTIFPWIRPPATVYPYLKTGSEVGVDHL
jgi:hypothetical protein